MKKKFFILFLCIISITTIGCNNSPNVIKSGLDVGITIGNHTYLPLNLDGIPNKHKEAILEILDIFEKAHPELEITFWFIDYSEGTENKDATHGLWIRHLSRKE